MKRLIIINLFLINVIFAQISPGELSKEHSKFEGLQNCTQCHILGEGLSNQKCLDCHKEINVRITKNSGYHASQEVLKKNCWSCHSEHNGRNFRLINFNAEKFDHKKTGYELTGKHSLIECKDCHQAKFIKDQNIKKEKTYLGLNRSCVSCHIDIHQKTAGSNCDNCHNTTSFTNKINFDHNKTKFPLLGSHKNQNCIDCHKKTKTDNSSILRFVSMESILCTDCHVDVHESKFGQKCLNCHNFNSFKVSRKQNFDHSKTGFDLIGKHQFVECKDCHKGKLTDPVKHEKCLDCHLDYHKGEFVINNSPRDCKNCHDENGFTPSKFTLENHQKTKFSLTGSHLAVDCSSCHKKKNEWKFRFSTFRCIECHENVHNQEISFKFMGKNDCENCHNTISWKNLNFDHDKTNFKLEGRHLKIKCGDCHIKNINNKKVHLFKSINSICLSCHNDVHNKQYISEECRLCHTFDSWKPTIFNHDRAQFKLSGAHEKIECNKCHFVQQREDGGTFIVYKIRRTLCTDCHSS